MSNSTKIFGSKFSDNYLKQQGTNNNDSFLHLAVDIRNVARQNQDVVLSQLKDELEEYLIGKTVEDGSAFSILTNLLKQLIEHNKSEGKTVKKIDRTSMPQIIPPRPNDCDDLFKTLTEDNLNSLVEGGDSEKTYITEIKELVIKAFQDINDKAMLQVCIVDFTNLIKQLMDEKSEKKFLKYASNIQNDLTDYIKRLFYLILRWSEANSYL